MMRRIVSIFIITVILISSCVACGTKKDDTSGVNHEPNLGQMRNICELATMDCYYHNVAKYSKEDASGALWWKKDRKFWVEYAGVVTIGIDTTLVNIEVNDDNVTITIPPAKVLGCKVDEATLNDDSFIIAKDSAKVEAQHQTEAYKDAQSKMQEEASSDTVLLASAQQRAQKLLEDYVNNIGNCVGKTYKIEWIYLDNAEKLQNTNTETP